MAMNQKQPLHLSSVWGFVLLLMAGSAFAADTDYVIKVNRPWHVGDNFKIEGTKVQHTTTAMPGSALLESQTSDNAFTLSGREEVMEIDPLGRASRAKITIDVFSVKTDGIERALLPTSAVVILNYQNGKLQASSDAKDLDAPTTSVFEGLCEIDDPGKKITEDEEFGGSQRRKVGDTWKVDAAKASARAKEHGVEIAPKDISGSMTLASVKVVDGQRCLQLAEEMSFKNLKPPGIPAGVNIEKSVNKYTMTCLVPVALDAPRMIDTMDTTINFSLSGDQGGTAFKLESNLSEKLTLTRSDFHIASAPATGGGTAR
jgi:polyisoprenoid-binding protein YceI